MTKLRLHIAAIICVGIIPFHASAQQREGSTSGDTAMIEELSNEVQAKSYEAEALHARVLTKNLDLQRLSILAAVTARDAAESIESYPLQSAIWKKPAVINVSWENPAPENEKERGWVKAAIERTWQKECGVVFTGWGKAESDTKGIRILIAEAHPHCDYLGRYLDGRKNGMVLNFEFKDWCPVCGLDRRGSIEKIAVHEFGHALGFAHEQNRPDTPKWCQDEQAPQGGNGDIVVTVWDPDSVMNYCNAKWNNNGFLSPIDISSARQLYGPPK